ncbi:MAG TPA: DUF4373 domain-containing protein [Bacilli bacterium]|nr:DUF4373 domain-containing protein [Bacilli bacterium]
MAGRPKRGLDYHVSSVNRLHDSNYAILRSKYKSNIAIGAYESLLDDILANGYYLKFLSLKNLCYIVISYSMCDSIETAEAIINDLVELGLFDKDSFDNGYLTSTPIQEQFLFATKSRKKHDLIECCLLTEERIKFILDGAKQKAILSGDNSILGGQDEDYLNQRTQSKRNSNSGSQRKRNKKDKLDITDLSFNPNYYLIWFINEGIVFCDDIFINELNDYLESVQSEDSEGILKDIIKYAIYRIRSSKWMDEDGYSIEDKMSNISEGLLMME